MFFNYTVHTCVLSAQSWDLQPFYSIHAKITKALTALREIGAWVRVVPLVGCVEFRQNIALLALGKRPESTSSVNGVQLKWVELADGITRKVFKAEGGN
jgi:hypothetical protein